MTTRDEIKGLTEHTEEQVKRLLRPGDAARLVRRLRGVSFFVRTQGELVTGEDEEKGSYRYVDASDTLKVSAAQAIKVLTRMEERAARMRVREEDPVDGRVRVTRLAQCLFIG